MRLILLIFSVFLIGFQSLAQSNHDILYLPEGPKEVKVKEIGQSNIKYTYPDEEVVYSINKFLVSKVEFKSGRVENFKSPLKPVYNLADAKDVYLTFNPDEVTGLYNLGNLFSKATGVTTLSSINNVNNRALEKLKYEAAMMGANAVYIGNQYQRGNQYGNEYTPGNSTQTSYSGMAFSNKKLNLDGIEELLKTQQLTSFQKVVLKRNGWSPKTFDKPSFTDSGESIALNIEKITRSEDAIFVTIPSLRAKSNQLKVISYKEDSITLMERDDNGITNYLLLTENHPFFKK
ncbi:hypothetical protein [Algoriphagus sp.]|uniref:hypothetical protein n=1 Tax=Algoriphagus sp. TaxID=1872435 RepID=UPI00262A0A3F|nr:hypothetical protein [Algoriphagus sp.]